MTDYKSKEPKDLKEYFAKKLHVPRSDVEDLYPGESGNDGLRDYYYGVENKTGYASLSLAFSAVGGAICAASFYAPFDNAAVERTVQAASGAVSLAFAYTACRLKVQTHQVFKTLRNDVLRFRQAKLKPQDAP